MNQWKSEIYFNLLFYTMKKKTIYQYKFAKLLSIKTVDPYSQRKLEELWIKVYIMQHVIKKSIVMLLYISIIVKSNY